MQEQLEKEKPTTTKKNSKVGLLFNPYLEGCRDLGNDPNYPPLRSRKFVKMERNANGETEFIGITVFPHPVLDNDATLWDELKQEHPQIKELIRKGAIVEYIPKTDARADTIAGYNVNDAKDIIESVRGVEGVTLLQEWAKTETRQTIQEAIYSRIEAIRTGRA